MTSSENPRPALSASYNCMTRLEQDGGAYMVTWRLAEGQSDLPPHERDALSDQLMHFHPTRYFLYAWVVMNDHVHLVCQPESGESMAKLLHSWKSFSANQMQHWHGRKGSIWQKDSFTRIIRSESDLREKANYILTNPERRWPACAEYQWRGYNWRS